MRNRATSRWRAILNVLGPFIGLLLVVAFFTAILYWQEGTADRFLSLVNLKLVLVHASVTAVVGLGMTLVMISGGIDLSVGYVTSLVTVTTMLAYRHAIASRGMDGLASPIAIAAGI